MRVGIVGSRGFRRLDLVKEFIATLSDDAIVVSGGARGVDTMAEMTAKLRGLKTDIYRPKWKKPDGTLDMKAGFTRNTLIIDNCDRVVAFWDGVSHGTQDSIKKARERGLDVLVVDGKS